MNYPADIVSFRTTLMNYQPAEDHADAIWMAQAATSPVGQAVDVFNALKSAPDLSQAGLALLLGAAHLIASGGWYGLAGEAATLLAQRAAQLQPVSDDPPQP